MIFHLNHQFNELFGKQPLFFAAPGRVNLIGEHTDYNEGFVLPVAIDKCIYVAISKNDSNSLNAFANQFGEQLQIPLDQLKPVKGWFTYLAGMMHFLRMEGLPVSGVDVIVEGDVPVGAGMSSSAAICSAFGFALNEIFCLGLDRMQIALLGQKTEHEFAGLKCGIMDQFASLHGKEGRVMKLDCRSMEYEYIPFHFPGYRIVLANSMVSHSLASSEYNVRRQQCEEGVRIMKQFLPDIYSLRDVSLAQLEQHKADLPPLVYSRCHYVITENIRLLQGCECLKQDDILGFGQLMYQSHQGLSHEYEVSCPELDYLVTLSKDVEGVAGSRMMGGGFGGCTINLVQTEQVAPFESFIQSRYGERFGRKPEIYVTQIEEGARRIPSNQ